MKSEDLFKNSYSRSFIRFWAVAFISFALPSLCWAQGGAAPEAGLYTSAQAEQGKKLYATRCAACHGADLGGLTAPPLVGPRFEKNWISTTTMDDLFFLMRTTMPLSMAKSLSAEQHAAIFAYVLEQNGYPAGDKPVQPDTPQLKT